MKPERSLPCSQQPSTTPYPKPDEYSPYPSMLTMLLFWAMTPCRHVDSYRPHTVTTRKNSVTFSAVSSSLCNFLHTTSFERPNIVISITILNNLLVGCVEVRGCSSREATDCGSLGCDAANSWRMRIPHVYKTNIWTVDAEFGHRTAARDHPRTSYWIRKISQRVTRRY